MRQCLSLILLGLLQFVPSSLFASETTFETPAEVLKYRVWVNEMEGLERGPFSRLRWFCNDGTVLPPRSYACKDHGGGFQHGEWSDKTLELRKQGYLVANILAGQDINKLVSNPDFRNIYAQILIEPLILIK